MLERYMEKQRMIVLPDDETLLSGFGVSVECQGGHHYAVLGVPRRGLFALDPEYARALAGELLSAADEAERGNR